MLLMAHGDDRPFLNPAEIGAQRMRLNANDIIVPSPRRIAARRTEMLLRNIYGRATDE